MPGEHAATHDDADIRPLDGRFAKRLLAALGGLVVLSALLHIAGQRIGSEIAAGGHTASAAVHEIVIGNNVLAIPANANRFVSARRDGIAERIDLYLHWPDLKGYTETTRDAFNHAGGGRDILFLSFQERTMSRDMSGRLEPIYRFLMEPDGRDGPDGVTLHDFDKDSGYSNEVLAVSRGKGREPFVARCLEGPAADEALAPCERDVHMGDNLSLTYRFPAELLGQWRALDRGVVRKAQSFLKTGG